MFRVFPTFQGTSCNVEIFCDSFRTKYTLASTRCVIEVIGEVVVVVVGGGDSGSNGARVFR